MENGVWYGIHSDDGLVRKYTDSSLSWRYDEAQDIYTPIKVNPSKRPADSEIRPDASSSAPAPTDNLPLLPSQLSADPLDDQAPSGLSIWDWDVRRSPDHPKRIDDNAVCPLRLVPQEEIQETTTTTTKTPSTRATSAWRTSSHGASNKAGAFKKPAAPSGGGGGGAKNYAEKPSIVRWRRLGSTRPSATSSCSTRPRSEETATRSPPPSRSSKVAARPTGGKRGTRSTRTT